jgi:hypothetical protein
VTAGTRKQRPSLMPIKSSKGFVEQSKANFASQQGTAKSDTLAFSARNQATAFSEFRLQSVGQFFKQLAKFGLFQQVSCGHTVRVAVTEIEKQRAIP